MKYKNFEDFLMDKFSKDDGQAILDDDWPDAFDAWISALDVEEWLKYGDEYKLCQPQ